VDVVAATLKQKLNLINKMITQQELMRQKQDDTQNQIDKLRPLLKLIIQRTKELQTEVCHFRFCHFVVYIEFNYR